jgi:hypothetical protein
MDASEPIRPWKNSCGSGAVHIWSPDADRRAKLSIYLAVEGALLDACSHPLVLLDIHALIESNLEPVADAERRSGRSRRYLRRCAAGLETLR